MRIYEQNGSWYYVVDVGRHPVTNKRVQKKKGGFKRERDAKQAAVKLLAEYQDGQKPVTEQMTFEALAELWLNVYPQRKQIKQSTVRIRQRYINFWFKHFKSIPVIKITPAMIQDVFNDIRPDYKDETLSGMYATIRLLLKFAKEKNLIKSNPIDLVYIPKNKKMLDESGQSDITTKYLEKDVLKLFLDTTKRFGMDAGQDYALFKLLAYTGLRIGEALALKWSDIDFTASTISVKKRIICLSSNVTKFELDLPKSSASERTIYVDSDVLETVEKLQLRQKELKLEKPNYKHFDFVFISFKNNPGYPVLNRTVNTRMLRICKIAKINQHVTSHTFRHTHTSLLAEAGVGLVEIMERLGHKDDTITRDIYLHVTKQLKKDAAVKFSKLMNGL